MLPPRLRQFIVPSVRQCHEKVLVDTDATYM